MVGTNLVFYCGAVLWQAIGFDEVDALLINVVSGELSLDAVVISLLLIDKVGRKPLLIIGSLGMVITLTLVVYAFSTSVLSVNSTLILSNSMGLLALVSANAYVMFFNFSWGPVMWVMLGEMFPNQIRGSGLAVSGLGQWLANFGITLTFPILLNTIGLSLAYGFYSISAFVSIFFVVKFVLINVSKDRPVVHSTLVINNKDFSRVAVWPTIRSLVIRT